MILSAFSFHRSFINLSFHQFIKFNTSPGRLDFFSHRPQSTIDMAKSTKSTVIETSDNAVQPQSQFTGATVIPSVTPGLEIMKVLVPSSSETAVPDGQNSDTVPPSVTLRMDVQEEPDSVEQSKKSRISSKLDFCDTKIVATMSLPSPPSITPGGAVHRCIGSVMLLCFSTLNPPANEAQIPNPQIKSWSRTPQRSSRSARRRTNALLLANVKRSGMKNVSEYIRSVTLTPHIVPRLNESEMRVAQNLSGMSNNFNQLLRLCHQRELDSMTRDVRFYLNQFRELFSKLSS